MGYRRLEIRRQIKEKARKIITRSFADAVKVCLLFAALYLFIQYQQAKILTAPLLKAEGTGIAAIVNAYLAMDWRQALSIAMIIVLAVIVLGPLLCSFCGFFLKITAEINSGQNESNEETRESLRLTDSLVWFYQKTARNKAIGLRVATTLLSGFWYALLVGPPLYLLYNLRGNPYSIKFANTSLMYTSWLIIGFIAACVKLGTYYPAYFLIAQDPAMPVAEALRESVLMMRGHAWEFFRYKLSFIPYYLISVVTFGVGLLYVVPYRGASDALFMRYIDSVSSGEDPF